MNGALSSSYKYFTVEVTSVLPASKAALWDSISTFRGVNYELFPILSMTCPEPDSRLSIDCVNTPANQPLFRSWILLFGILPIEFDLIRIESFVEGTGFKERSSMGLFSNWNHDRTLESVVHIRSTAATQLTSTTSSKSSNETIDKNGDISNRNNGMITTTTSTTTTTANTNNGDDNFTRVVDRLSFKPRIQILGHLMKYVIKFLFLYRHSRLAKMFGGVIVPTTALFINS